jgi:hypothetical protein
MRIKLKVHSAWEIKEPQSNNMQTHEYEKGGEKNNGHYRMDIMRIKRTKVI